MSLTAIGFWIIHVAGVGAALLQPVVGILLYILVYHMNPQHQWWGQSIRAVGLRTSAVVVVAIVIGLVVRRPRFEGVGRQFPMPIVCAIGLALLALASMAWGYGVSDRGAFQVEKFIKVMVFVLILIRCIREPAHYHLVILAWLCGVLYVGYQAWGNVGVHIHGRLASGLGGPDFAESVDLAVHLVATLPLIGAMFFMARRWWYRGLLLIIGALAVNTIIMTRARTAVVALVAMAIVGCFSLPRRYRIKGVLAICAGALFATQLTDPEWWERIATTVHYADDSSAIARIEYWQAAVAMSIDYPFGIGAGNFQEVVKEYIPSLRIVRSAHNTYFECLAELGYIGLLLLLATLAVTLWRLLRGPPARTEADTVFPIDVGYWRTEFHIGWHTMALRSALVGYAVSGMFTTRLFAEDFWMLIGLAACLHNIRLRVQHRLEGASPSATPLLVPCMSKAVSAVAPWSRRRRVEPRGRPPSYRSESDTLYVRSKGVGNRRNKRGASGAGARLRGLAAIWRGPTVSRCALKGGLGTAPIVAESDPLTPVVDCDGLDEQGDDVDDLLGALDGVFTPGLDPRTRDVGDIDGLLVLLSLHDEMHESSGEHDGHEPADPDLPSPPV